MRILEVIPSYLPATRYGGPVIATHELCKALVRRGHEVQVYTTYGGQTQPLPPGRSEIDGVIVNYFKSDRFPRLSWAPELGRQLKREIHSFDIVHLHTVFLWPTWIAARLAREHRVPYILSPRGMLVKDLIERRSRLAKLAWIKFVEKTNLKRAAAVHVTSSNEADDLAMLDWKLPRIVTIPNGVDWQEPKGPMSADIAEIVSLQPYALFFGRLSWKKGLDTLLKAFARTTRGALIIAGTDDEGLSHGLRRSANKLGIADRVHIIARTISGADKYHLFRSARVFALPSYSENFGNTVLEALASGIPAIVTPEVGAAEIVIAARAGLVVPKEPAAWAAALEKILLDGEQAKQLGEAGRNYVLANCSWDGAAARMEQLYRECVASGCSRSSSNFEPSRVLAND
jgi:glycosyltransferase involved in cell wall biosynthesis